MSFGDFQFPKVLDDLGLTIQERDLCSHFPPVPARPEFLKLMNLGASVAQATNTEKARSEFIIAPVLLELKQIVGDQMGLFSGVILDGDSSRGLQGICDFILTRSGKQLVVTAPLVTIVEAKNDNLLSGLGQCIAAMYAAEIVNSRAGTGPKVVFGVVTTGSAWKFLRLEGKEITADTKEYYVDDVPKVLGILTGIVRA